MSQDRPVLGILLMLGFCVVAPMGDAVAKILGATIPLGFLLLMRFSVQVVALWPLVALAGRPWRMQGRVLRLTLLRTVLHIIGIGAMFTALIYLPLADAVAIAFVMPFIMLLLGKYILGEEVGMRRLLACVVGFIGTLLVIQPSFAEVGWPALLPLVVAVVFSFFMLTTRQIAKETDPIGLQMVSGVMAIAILIPALGFGHAYGIETLQAIWPTLHEAGLLLAIGLLGTAAHLLMTWSLRYAPSATLAPMQYLEIPVATVIGWLIFRDLPNTLASVGICITIAAGLYIIARERRLSRACGSGPQHGPSRRRTVRCRARSERRHHRVQPRARHGDKRPGPIHLQRHRPLRHVRRPDPPVRGQLQPVDGPGEPPGTPGHAQQRVDRDRVACDKRQGDLSRRVKHNLLGAQQKTGPVRMTDQRTERGKLVIQPSPQKPHAQDQRRCQRPQRLVEIGAVLLANPVDRIGRDAGAILGAQAVKVPDHRMRHMPFAQRIASPAIRCNQQWRMA